MLLYLWILAHAVTAAIISAIILPPLKQMLKDAGAVKANYQQREVVNMMGIIIILTWVSLIGVAALFSSVVDMLGLPVPQGFIISPDIAMPLTIIVIGAGLFGLIDDLLGSRESTGFRGHIGALFKGRLTTGALKAVGIPVVAILSSSLFSSGILEVLGNAILIALFVNALNLLDLRPGRALKFYIPLQLFFVYAAGSTLGSSSAALIGIALILLGPDLREEIMLGDTGANVLGGILGFCLVVTFGWNIKLPVIVLLILLQVLTEKYSISAIIERVPILKSLDDLGRRAD
ncbi:MAG TPA: hypothetical protein VE439_03785 [Anaerolineae bacterium]|nr:hypothetical protein [Anaerolineae bacterium]